MTGNVLVSSAGRRVSLIHGFQEAVAGTGRQVFAADLAPEHSAGCQVADESFRLPRVESAEFAETLLDLCRRRDIAMVVPTIDPELPVLAAMRERFEQEGIQLVVSDPSLIEDCQDKRRTKRLFDRLGLRRPAVYTLPEVSGYPVFVKPYDGSASDGIAVIESRTELDLALAESDRLMICEYFDPADHDEFTVDCYFDRHGELRCAVPRQRIEVRGGEVSKSMTAKNELVEELFAQMATLPGARGMITVQAFIDRRLRTSSYIEINARAGGGYPLTRLAGADYQRYLVDEYLDGTAPPTFRGWKDRALMLRYDAEVVLFDA